MFKQLLILTIILILFTGISLADIINIPEDYVTIQAGIDATEEGDTVLVQPGVYRENINIYEHSMTLASLTLMTGDPAYIDSTIIDGRSQATVVNISQIEGTVTLGGFIIQNGYARNGGGVTVQNSDILIEDMIIRNNTGQSGGGVYCNGESTIIIRRTVIENNRSSYAAALYLGEVHATLEDMIIRENIGGHVGVSKPFGSLNMRNVALLNNEGEYPGIEIVMRFEEDMVWENVTAVGQIGRHKCFQGGIRENATLILRNCLIYGNEHDGLSLGGTISLSYSLIEGGRDAVVGQGLEWGEGNIDDDPLFVDPENGDYHLTEDSPCIDAGDPESDPDPDGSRADIGAFFFQQGGVIEGFVYDLESEDPLEGAVITLTTGVNAVSNDEGFWRIENAYGIEFDLTASRIGYIDLTMIDLELEIFDTLSIDIGLLHAELEPSIEEIDTDIEIGDRTQIDFSIGNPGNGALDWSVITSYRGDAGLDPWELRQSYQLGEQLEDSRLYGVAFVDSLFYIAGANNEEPTIYILNQAGELVGSFPQPGNDNRGMKDLAWDGELLWGSVRNFVFGMTLDGEVESFFEAPYHPSTAITWDPDRELLWISGIVSDPVGMDREGNLVDEMRIDRDGLRIHGMAYFPEDIDNAPLYLFCKEIETDLQTLIKHNFETDEKIFVKYLEPEAGGFPRGSFITDQLDNYSWTFMSIADNANNDRMDIWQLEAKTSWSIIDPIAGSIDPNAEQDITLIIDASDLIPIYYPAQLVFTHNGFGLETVIPIDLTVTPLGVYNPDETILPLEFSITEVFPNPFNLTVRLDYTVPIMSNVLIKMYDITGSLVDFVNKGNVQSGQHSVTWNASAMPSGIYFARMEAGEISQFVKLILIK